ncbi:probable ubiquitin-like-specific protease 2B isoform X1 [Rosa chinensis]|uniref:probable ubiquitin-like-specific protease 2B isoform X1 n=1 Tax=Rosa chinensis TaxID=74649 RepID=UPI000D08D412|nr:probable ubiquitin-like-specific protease 2B isoform X1 [Rosa chinensis]
MNSAPPRRGLEVYDFVDEDEFPDPVVKFSGKLKNPSREDHRNSKDEFLQPGSKEANVQAKEISSIPCVEVDEVDTDHCCKNAISHSPRYTIEERLAIVNDLKLSAATDSSHEQSDLCSKEANVQAKEISSIPCVGVDEVDTDHCCKNAISHSPLYTIEERRAIINDLKLGAATDSSHEQQSDLCSKEANVQAKEISSIPCVGVDEVDTDHCCKNAISHSPLYTIEERRAIINDLKLGAATDSSHEQQSDLCSKEANVQAKEISSIPCVDVDEVDTDHCCKNAISHSTRYTIEERLAIINDLKLSAATDSSHEQQSDLDKVSNILYAGVDAMDHDHCSDSASLDSRPGTMEEDPATKKDYLELDAATQSKFLSHEQQSELDDNGRRKFLSETETGGSDVPSPSPQTSQLDCDLTVSPSSNDPVDVISDADESTSESPSSPLSPIEEDDGSLGTYELGHCSGNFEMDNINMTVVLYPDYVVYGDSYCTGAQQLTFSHSCIKISGLALSENDKTLNFEWGVDDLVNVECQWVQNAEFVMIKLHVLSKDADGDDGALGISGIEELKIGVVEPNWSQQQERIACLNDKYLDILEPVQISMEADNSLGQRHHFPNFDEDFETVVYPEGDPDAVSISKRDVDLLQPEIFINDTLIDFYIKYLENRIQPEEKHRFYFFNSFFFRKLADLDKDPSSVPGGRAAFQRVRKWTRKVDLFEKDYIFIPVNFNLHWTLIVICHPGEVPRYKVGDSGKSVKVPCILHLDSLKGSHTGLKNHVQSYLWEEWKEKKKETSEEISSNFHNLRFLSLELPQQENTYDCGLFLLHYLELFLEEAPAIFNPFDINKFSTFLNANWFLPSEASLKRTLIQRLIFDLIENRYREVCLPACSDGDQSKYQGCNQLEIGAKFLSGRSSPAIACQENISTSQADHGIEMTLLPTSSLRSSECVSDAGLVLREFFQSGETAGSLFGQYQSFEQKSPFYHPNGATPPVEEETQTGEQFAYLATGDTGFQEMSTITSQTCGIQCSSKSYGVETSYNLGVSEQAPNGNIDASPDRSVCASDLSEGIEIIENGSVREDLGPGQKEEMDVQNYPSLDSVTCVVDGLVSGLGEVQSGSLIEEGSQDHEGVHDALENGGPSRKEERDVQTHSSTEDVLCLADGLVSGSGNMQSTSVTEESSLDQKKVHVGNENSASLPLSQEISDIPVLEDVDMVGNGTISCDNGLVGESQEPESEEQRAAKRMRLTPPVEGEKCLT